MNEKKSYATPVLTVHGDVETITQGFHLANSDVPAGVANTAFPTAS